ncbi:MAG: beta-lactamase family protein [bacterium]|nr:beta-lactamase family protein [bacterium]
MTRLKSLFLPRLVAGGVVVLMSLCAHTVLAYQQIPEEPPLRHTEPLEAVVADLEEYIPIQLDSSRVPGLAIALVRDGQVAWAEGFGVANRITGTPVTPDTAFEAASISKVVTAYTALRLVDQGRLTLDEPLSDSLVTPWLGDSDYAREITLRHVASHSAGLKDNDLGPIDKTIAFDPGSQFAYSGVGFLYMQQAIEQVSNSSLEEAAQTLVFESLGMQSSSFEGRANLEPHMANGHIGYVLPLLFLLIPFAGFLLVLTLVGIVVLRISTGRWRPGRRSMVVTAFVAALLALVVLYFTLGRILPNLALLAVLSTLLFCGGLALASFLLRKMIARLAEPPMRPRLYMLGMVLTVGGLLLLSAMMTGPIPTLLSPPPSAVGSLQTTAPDLASFLAEIATPELLDADTAGQIRTPQIAVNEDFSWGLGIGIQHSDQGDALWQNGMTPGFRSVMVIYPEHQWGVVVLTNSDAGSHVAYNVAARALGGKAQWSSF